ncbi:site-specific integrase [Sunxiuqinia sp. A32]|uniref:site-specific integrase n=1 Tax=Sunxiuqinia sp. A32 TaxID=3461496 RepID=UPI00404544C0
MKKNISFYIAKKRIGKKGLAPIYGQVSINSKKYPFQIEKVKPRFWNSSKQRVNKNRENEPDNRHEEINELIERISKNMERFDRFNNYNEPPQRNEVKSVFFHVGDKMKSFNEAYEEFIESNRGKIAYNTTRNRNTAKNFIFKYENFKCIKLQFSDINLEFFDGLFDFAFDEMDLEDNAFAAYVAKFKSFMKWAANKGYHTNLEYQKFSFSEKDKAVVCLTPDELKILSNFDFENERLEKARDLYCFGCYTGLRFSDIATLRHEHFQSGYIVKNITKTKEDDRIPILPQAKEILNTYSNGSIYPLPRVSNPKLNEYIKECCELARIDTPTIQYKYKRNQVIESVLPKYKLITVHTARKTFITIGFILGIDTKVIKSITGHKKDSTFDKYLKIADEIKKEKMLDAWRNF